MENNINLQKAIFAGGCFWCTEAIFKNLKGVEQVLPGYIGGHTVDPTYEQVCTGETGFAEAIQIMYDGNVVNYNQLLEVFFATHNPTTLNRQGADVGTQYRSEIFYTGLEQKTLAEEYIAVLSQERVFEDPIVTVVSKATLFYVAEDYHKDYFAVKGDSNPYCQMVVKPKVDKFMTNFSNRVK
ncbi:MULTISPECIES: peptide-methionine (S)-S-oxide reductase MsrA [Myroides]|uniref:Peptide methionine sulfoxide reductase MsrA n=1 Tax=Myroides albus TaxID=2562892 RepID=A0A6I3LID4_9FLAO|nr:MULTISPECIES: peptide-methionine (S)-S-oxide reductase MsrA [Myroides]MTG98308.1 peptide-methionine (S)-S-oxide reductase MsrA [Myroides albus]MVX36484.1 peptide-methionine (S)-S-oxide reductase MsrA [Myroides sp. LoEW2-1]UVD79620.1 peptide-methionine (S)-S-oxide reductase MsrA [Myroides albus]